MSAKEKIVKRLVFAGLIIGSSGCIAEEENPSEATLKTLQADNLTAEIIKTPTRPNMLDNPTSGPPMPVFPEETPAEEATPTPSVEDMAIGGGFELEDLNLEQREDLNDLHRRLFIVQRDIDGDGEVDGTILSELGENTIRWSEDETTPYMQGEGIDDAYGGGTETALLASESEEDADGVLTISVGGANAKLESAGSVQVAESLQIISEDEIYAVDQGGNKVAMVSPVTKQWLSPNMNKDQVVLNPDGTSDFTTEVIPAPEGDITNENTYWNETGELLPSKPEEAEGLKHHSGQTREGKLAAYLVDDSQGGELQKRYIYEPGVGGEEGEWQKAMARYEDLTEDNYLYGWDTGQGRQHIEFGLSTEYSSPEYTYEGVRDNILSGILLEAPFVDDEGFVNFVLGIPDDVNEVYRVVNYRQDAFVKESFFDGEPFLPITPIGKSIKGGFRISTSESSWLEPLEEIIERYKSNIGNQIAFKMDIGDIRFSLEEYYRNEVLHSPRCDENCQYRFQRIVERLGETYKTINYLKVGDARFDGGTIVNSASIYYVPVP